MIMDDFNPETSEQAINWPMGKMVLVSVWECIRKYMFDIQRHFQVLLFRIRI